jgi:hypothetical protein
MEALTKLADTSGQLSLKELAQLDQPRTATVKDHIARLTGRDDESVAHATLKGAQASLQAAGDGLVTLMRSMVDENSFTSLDRVARRINHAAVSVGEALSKSALSYASPEDLREIRNAWSGFLQNVAQHLQSLRSAREFFEEAGGKRSVSQRVSDAYESIGWLCENFNLFDVRTKREDAWEAEKGSYSQRLLGLGQLGHGLVADHPDKAEFARFAYETISSFDFPHASREGGGAIDRHRLFHAAAHVRSRPLHEAGV